jgi:murein DD-endopeptidase MepM/ murein hydrolase activator NlpD
MTSVPTCFACGQAFNGDPRWALMRGRADAPVDEEHCCEACVRYTIRQRRIAGAAIESRWLLRLLTSALVLAGASVLWHRFRTLQPESISFDPPASPVERPVAPSGAIALGPAWPPTDADWEQLLSQSSWLYPLSGPIRRAPIADSRIIGPASSREHVALCRTEGHCGVDLGGDLWGEHVYAAQDGVVSRVRRAMGDAQSGQSVRLAHLGGSVFTHYSNLAGIPRGLSPGDRVKAGDVIGLVGDTDSKGPRRHLYFALSVQASSALPEIYWDPTPWMSAWPLRMPAHGTVAGFTPDKDPERIGPRTARRRGQR